MDFARKTPPPPPYKYGPLPKLKQKNKKNKNKEQKVLMNMIRLDESTKSYVLPNAIPCFSVNFNLCLH